MRHCFIASLLAVSLGSLLLCSTTNGGADNSVGCGSTAAVRETYSLPDMPAKLDFCGERVPLEREDIAELMDRELITNAFWHTNTILVIKRAARYFPIIEPILKENGIPDDIKYLAVAESALVPTVKSPAGAVGLWQILEQTGKELGMEITQEVDERCNVRLATEAACRYLRRSYEALGSWTLVAASYNGGLARVKKNCANQLQNNYYDVSWLDETNRYVFRIIAFKTIMGNPEAYGFSVPESGLYKPYKTRTVEVSAPIDDLARWAVENGTTYRMLKLYNPWLRSTKLSNPKGRTYRLML